MDNEFLFQAKEGDEDTISLSDFAINSYENDDYRDEFSTFKDLRSPPSDQADIFEFFSDLNSTMSHAEDIIFCGQLIPYKDQEQTQNPTPKINEGNNESYGRRRSESFSDVRTCRKSAKADKGSDQMRSSRSLDYNKLSREYSSIGYDSPDIRNTSSARSSKRFDGNSTAKITKPRWYVLLFGNFKVHQEMDLQDIKHRQVRRTPSAPINFQAVGAAKGVPVNRKSSWGVMKVLSCRDDASVRVTTSSLPMYA